MWLRSEWFHHHFRCPSDGLRNDSPTATGGLLPGEAWWNCLAPLLWQNQRPQTEAKKTENPVPFFSTFCFRGCSWYHTWPWVDVPRVPCSHGILRCSHWNSFSLTTNRRSEAPWRSVYKLRHRRFWASPRSLEGGGLVSMFKKLYAMYSISLMMTFRQKCACSGEQKTHGSGEGQTCQSVHWKW